MHVHIDLATAAYRSRWRDANPAEPALFSAGLLVLALALTPRPWSVAVLAIAAAAAIGSARVGAYAWLRWMASPVLFAAVASLGLAWSDPHAAANLLLRASAASACTALLSLTVSFPSLLWLGRQVRAPEPVLELAWIMHGSAHLMVDHVVMARSALRRRAPARGWRAEVNGFAMAAASAWRCGSAAVAARDRSAERRLAGVGLVLLAPRSPARPLVCAAALVLHFGIALAARRLAQ